MKVLICTTDDYPHHGGKSTHISDLISGFTNKGIEYEIFDRSKIDTLNYKFIKLFIQPIKLFSLQHYIYYRKKIELFLYSQKIKKVINSMNFSVISAQDAAACTIVGRINSNLPIVLTMHTYIGIELTLDNPFFHEGNNLFENLYNFESESLSVANSVVAVDKRIEQHILDLVNSKYQENGPQRILSISNFTDTDKYIISNDAVKDNLRLKFDIKKNEFVICCARRLVEKNGVLSLIEAININDNYNIIVLVAGDGPQMHAIKQYIAENNLGNRVRLLGSLDSKDLIEIYTISDIAVVPSITVNGLQEATSISAIESMACGLPTVASDIGGLKQLISHRETGILVDENNPTQIANAIVELMENKKLRSKISKNARDFIVSNHSHIKSTEKYLDEFNYAINNFKLNTVEVEQSRENFK